MPDGGLWIPDSAREAGVRIDPNASLPSHVASALRAGIRGLADDSKEIAAMAARRAAMRREASAAAVNSYAGITQATARPRDPLFYWEQNNLPYDFETREGLRQIRKYARLLYLTHPIVASAIDIYSTWPLQEMELTCKDEALTDFYTELFMDQLEYEEFLVDLGREYWTVGEGFGLGSFNEVLGVWEADELIDPDEVEVITSPFLKEPRYEMMLPKTIREVLEKREPKHEYEALMRSYPELRYFMNSGLSLESDAARMPVSSILLRRIKFKGHNFSERGLPILMRAFRTLRQEEMLNSAYDAVADRLITPMVLVKLGASAQDLGTQTPWIPTPADIQEFESRLDAALAADFRVLTSHFAVNVQSVFGREVIPRVEQDFERIDNRILQVFGISKTMLSGANKGETYAADALNFELVSQLLSRYQRLIKRHYMERAKVVAEAQQHYDYEVRGGKRYPIMEEILEIDENGDQRIVERPKLLVPEMNFRVMNLQSEKDRRQLVEALRASGVPISNKTRLTNIPIDLDEERRLIMEEQVADAVATAQAQRDTYQALKKDRLPIPEDLKEMFEPHALEAAAEDTTVTSPDVQQPLPRLSEPIVDITPLVPPPPQGAATGDGGGEAGPPQTKTLPKNQWAETRPEQSDERREGMPRAASAITADGKVIEVPEHAFIDPAALKFDYESRRIVHDEEGRPLMHDEVGVLQLGPRHIGRRLKLDPDKPLDDQISESNIMHRREAG